MTATRREDFAARVKESEDFAALVKKTEGLSELEKLNLESEFLSKLETITDVDDITKRRGLFKKEGKTISLSEAYNSEGVLVAETSADFDRLVGGKIMYQYPDVDLNSKIILDSVVFLPVSTLSKEIMGNIQNPEDMAKANQKTNYLHIIAWTLVQEMKEKNLLDGKFEFNDDFKKFLDEKKNQLDAQIQEARQQQKTAQETPQKETYSKSVNIKVATGKAKKAREKLETILNSIKDLPISSAKENRDLYNLSTSMSRIEADYRRAESTQKAFLISTGDKKIKDSSLIIPASADLASIRERLDKFINNVDKKERDLRNKKRSLGTVFTTKNQMDNLTNINNSIKVTAQLKASATEMRNSIDELQDLTYSKKPSVAKQAASKVKSTLSTATDKFFSTLRRSQQQPRSEKEMEIGQPAIKKGPGRSS